LDLASRRINISYAMLKFSASFRPMFMFESLYAKDPPKNCNSDKA
jgi:hypothetical protein